MSVLERGDQGNIRKTLKWNKSEKPTRVLILTVATCGLVAQEEMVCENGVTHDSFLF